MCAILKLVAFNLGFIAIASDTSGLYLAWVVRFHRKTGSIVVVNYYFLPVTRITVASTLISRL